MIETAGAGAPHVQSVREDFSGRDLARMTPLINVLSNGSLAVVSTSTGASMMLHNGDPVTQWDPDEAGRRNGHRSFIRNIESGEVWSLDVDDDDPDSVLVSMDAGVTEITRKAAEIEATTSVMVLSDADIEARRIRLRNTSSSARSIELLSLVDLAGVVRPVLPTNGADAPLRVLLEEKEGTRHINLLSRGAGTGRTAVVATSDVIDPTSHTFGRIINGVTQSANASSRTSVAIVRRITLSPLAEVNVDVFTAVSMEDGPAPMLPSEASFDFDAEVRNSAGREVERMLMHHVRPDQSRYFRRIGGAVAFDLPQFRAPVDMVRRLSVPIRKIEQHGLRVGRPAIVARVADETEMKLVRCLLTAHRYWKDAAIPIDLMFLNDRSETDSAEKLQMLIENEAAENDASLYERGGVLSEYADDILHVDQIAIQVYASFLAPGELPRLADFQYTDDDETSHRYTEEASEALTEDTSGAVVTSFGPLRVRLADEPREKVSALNREHVVSMDDHVSGAPAGISQWFFLRDETNHTFRSLRPSINDRSGARDLSESENPSEIIIAGHPELPVQLARLTLRNEYQDERMMSVFMLAEPAFGIDPESTRRFVHASWLPREEALLAYNGEDEAFRTAPVFAAVRADNSDVLFSTDRTAFIGRSGSIRHPRLLRYGRDLDDSTSNSVASAVILQARISLGGGESTFVDFLIGHGESEREVRRILKSVSKPADRSAFFDSP